MDRIKNPRNFVQNRVAAAIAAGTDPQAAQFEAIQLIKRNKARLRLQKKREEEQNALQESAGLKDSEVKPQNTTSNRGRERLRLKGGGKEVENIAPET